MIQNESRRSAVLCCAVAGVEWSGILQCATQVQNTLQLNHASRSPAIMYVCPSHSVPLHQHILPQSQQQ